jgi:hypothetical protein
LSWANETSHTNRIDRTAVADKLPDTRDIFFWQFGNFPAGLREGLGEIAAKWQQLPARNGS